MTGGYEDAAAPVRPELVDVIIERFRETVVGEPGASAPEVSPLA